VHAAFCCLSQRVVLDPVTVVTVVLVVGASKVG
jgi:hypothetical protein